MNQTELVFLWATAVAANVWAKRVCDRRSAFVRTSAPLYDVVHSRCSLWDPALVDNAIFCQAMLFLIQWWMGFATTQQGIAVITLQTKAFSLRALTLALTDYPPPVVRDSIWTGRDLMFSGHTLVLFSFARCPVTYALAAMGAAVSTLSREHYTSDVVVSVVVTELLKACASC